MPHIHDVARRAIEEAQVRWREVDVVDLAVLNVPHALIVTDAQGQDAAHHGSSVRNVTIEEHGWVRNLHLLVLWINVVDKGIDRLREVIGGANVHIRSCGRLRGEVSSRRNSHSRFWLHDVGDENVLAVLDELLLVQGKIRIAAGLIQRMT